MFLTPLINADRIKRGIYRLFKFRNKIGSSLGNAGYSLVVCVYICVCGCALTRPFVRLPRCGVCQSDPAHTPFLSGSRPLITSANPPNRTSNHTFCVVCRVCRVCCTHRLRTHVLLLLH
jgi:hypothetical protein